MYLQVGSKYKKTDAVKQAENIETYKPRIEKETIVDAIYTILYTL